MALEFTVFADSSRFIASVKSNANSSALEAVSELDRKELGRLIDQKITYRGLEVRKRNGKLLFIGILMDKDEIHRDRRGRFHQMPLHLYAQNSPPKSLVIYQTLWSAHRGIPSMVKGIIKTRRFGDPDWEHGLEQEQQQAQNTGPVPAPAPAVGMWATAQRNMAVGNGTLMTFNVMGEHKGEVDDDFGGGGISLV